MHWFAGNGPTIPSANFRRIAGTGATLSTDLLFKSGGNLSSSIHAFHKILPVNRLHLAPLFSRWASSLS
jgi:hypothetical protein